MRIPPQFFFNVFGFNKNIKIRNKIQSIAHNFSIKRGWTGLVIYIQPHANTQLSHTHRKLPLQCIKNFITSNLPKKKKKMREHIVNIVPKLCSL